MLGGRRVSAGRGIRGDGRRFKERIPEPMSRVETAKSSATMKPAGANNPSRPEEVRKSTGLLPTRITRHLPGGQMALYNYGRHALGFSFVTQ